MRTTIAIVLPFLFPSFAILAGESVSELKPIMAQPDQVVLRQDFSEAEPLKKDEWQPRQGTRWAIQGGRLIGLPSTAEYQAKKPHHKGLEARISVPKTPAEFIAKFSIRFLEGSENEIVPFFEFGHHVCRLKFSSDAGLSILADGESVRVAEAADLKYEPGKWYHVLAELKGEEFVVQFANGPALYAKHPCFARPVPSGGNGLGIAGPRSGRVEIDDLIIWNVKPEPQDGWTERRVEFPQFAPVPTGKASKTNPKKPAAKP